MRILVTGGAGFIASHVVDKYVESGHQVEVIDDMSMGTEENKRDNVIYHELDIRSEEVSHMFEKGKFDVVNHHAAQMDVRKSAQDPVFDADVEVRRAVMNERASGLPGGRAAAQAVSPEHVVDVEILVARCLLIDDVVAGPRNRIPDCGIARHVAVRRRGLDAKAHDREVVLRRNRRRVDTDSRRIGGSGIGGHLDA